MSVIRSYLGALPTNCNYCFDEESNSKSLLETICCTNSLGTEVIPRTYHRDCLKKWAENKPEDFINCFVCDNKIFKKELYSNRELIIQKLAPYAECMECTAIVALIVALWTGLFLGTESGMISRMMISSIVTAMALKCFTMMPWPDKSVKKIIPSLIIPSACVSLAPAILEEIFPKLGIVGLCFLFEIYLIVRFMQTRSLQFRA